MSRKAKNFNPLVKKIFQENDIQNIADHSLLCWMLKLRRLKAILNMKETMLQITLEMAITIRR